MVMAKAQIKSYCHL